MSAESSASAKAAKGPSDSAKPNAGNSQNKTSSPSSIGLRQSPVTPLAPLEFLQNQRRGSITDPSLHAASSNINIHTLSSGTNNIPPALRHPESVAPAQSRPSTAYRFGDASGQSNENTLPNIRRLLRSPSTEGDSPVERAQDLSGSERSPTAASARVPRDSKNSDRMNVDIQPNHFQQSHDSAPQDRPSSEHFDFKGRRSSIAGTKRKMSSDRTMAGLGNGDGDTQLVGPGVPSALDAETPASKRRNSTIDTQRIAQLSLYDRRNSVDARAGGGPQWWGNERRDSAPSMLSNTPMTGYSTPPSGFSGDSPHGRPPSSIATFAWPVNTQADQSQTQASGPPPPGQNEANMSSAPHYDPLAMMPPVSFPPDRRMSAPAISPENMSLPPSSGPTRALRSRSRPPSRVRARDQSALTNTAQSPGPPSANVIQEDAGASSSQHSPQLKESGSAPYSRSPELRVSHKLAERKRRKEMKDLFDELRDQLPADRGMKASKWEILSKAIDFIVTLKQSHQDMSREIDMLRHELDGVRQGLPPPPFGPGGPGPMYGHGPPPGLPYPPPPGPSGPPVPPLPPTQLQQTLSRPGSSHNHSYPSGTGPVPPLTAQNGTATPTSVAKTDTPS